MKKRVWFAMSVAGMCTAALLSAQAPNPSTQTGASSTSADRVTITGCVARATPSPTGTSGAAGAAAAKADETKFMLTNASSGGGGASSTAGTSGSTASSSTNAAQYRLDGTDAQLTAHVGHKVEISGMITEKAAASSSASGATASSTATGPMLKVDSVKMIAQTCP